MTNPLLIDIVTVPTHDALFTGLLVLTVIHKTYRALPVAYSLAFTERVVK